MDPETDIRADAGAPAAPDLAAEVARLKADLEAERAARKAEGEKTTQDLMRFASMRPAAAPAAVPAGPQPPRPIDYDKLPDPDLDRRAYDRALDAERQRVAREERAYDQAQASARNANAERGTRLRDMFREKHPDIHEDLATTAAAAIMREWGEAGRDAQQMLELFPEQFMQEVANRARTYLRPKAPVAPVAPVDLDGPDGRAESVFGGGPADRPAPPGAGEEPLGSLTGDLKRMQRKAGLAW